MAIDETSRKNAEKAREEKDLDDLAEEDQVKVDLCVGHLVLVLALVKLQFAITPCVED